MVLSNPDARLRVDVFDVDMECAKSPGDSADGDYLTEEEEEDPGLIIGCDDDDDDGDGKIDSEDDVVSFKYKDEDGTDVDVTEQVLDDLVALRINEVMRDTRVDFGELTLTVYAPGEANEFGMVDEHMF